MSKEKAQYFADVELARILGWSERRLAKIVDEATEDSTIGDIVSKISEELIRTANHLKSAVADFTTVKFSDL